MSTVLAHFNMAEPASEEAIQEFKQLSGLELPADYITFLKKSNGGEGLVGKNAYLILWPVEQLINLNKAYQVEEYIPGLLFIGSDGGGEAIALDTRVPTYPVVSVPFVGMDSNLIRLISSNFNGFFEALASSSLKSKIINFKPISNSQYAGQEVFEIHPLILGGDATDPENKTVLTREQHLEAVRYWNNQIRQQRIKLDKG